MKVLLLYYLRRSWILGVASAVATFAFAVIGCRVFARMEQTGGTEMSTLFAQFMPQWVQSAFSIAPESMSQLNGFLAVCLQHPFLMTVTLALPVALFTGWLTGDVEKRSIALVLARPVGRFQLVTTMALVGLGWCALAVAGVGLGCYFGAQWSGLQEGLSTQHLAQATLNLAALVFAFAGIFAAISASLSIRGDAVGWCLTLVLVMYVWNFLAQIWYSGGGTGNYSLFKFYTPTEILLNGQFDPANAVVLAGVGLMGFAASTVVFALRSFSV